MQYSIMIAAAVARLWSPVKLELGSAHSRQFDVHMQSWSQIGQSDVAIPEKLGECASQMSEQTVPNKRNSLAAQKLSRFLCRENMWLARLGL
jgi:hypothetical protein